MRFFPTVVRYVTPYSKGFSQITPRYLSNTCGDNSNKASPDAAVHRQFEFEKFKKQLEETSSQQLNKIKTEADRLGVEEVNMLRSRTELSVTLAQSKLGIQREETNSLLKSLHNKTEASRELVHGMTQLALGLQDATTRYQQQTHDNRGKQQSNYQDKQRSQGDRNYRGWERDSFFATAIIGALAQIATVWWFGYKKPRKDALYDTLNKEITELWRSRSELTADMTEVSEFFLTFHVNKYLFASQPYTKRIITNKRATIDIESRFKAKKKRLKDLGKDALGGDKFDDLINKCDLNISKLAIMDEIQDLVIDLDIDQAIFTKRYQSIKKKLADLMKNNSGVKFAFYLGFIKTVYEHRAKDHSPDKYTKFEGFYELEKDDKHFTRFKNEFKAMMEYDCQDAVLAKYIFIQLKNPIGHYAKTCSYLMDIRNYGSGDKDYKELSDKINDNINLIYKDDIEKICKYFIAACNAHSSFVPALTCLGFIYLFAAMLLDAENYKPNNSTYNYNFKDLGLKTMSGTDISLKQIDADLKKNNKPMKKQQKLNEFKRRLLEESNRIHNQCALLDINRPNVINNIVDIRKELGIHEHSKGDAESQKNACALFQQAKTLIVKAKKEDPLSEFYGRTLDEIEKELNKGKCPQP